jgi:hypothetical protein
VLSREIRNHVDEKRLLKNLSSFWKLGDVHMLNYAVS